MLALSNFDKLLKIDCDASGKGIGDILSQEEQLIEYLSKKLNEAR